MSTCRFFLAPLTLAVLACLAQPVCADGDDVAVAQARFLATRDAPALVAALEAHPDDVDEGVFALARMAAGLDPQEAVTEGQTGRGAVPALVTALHALDVKRARRLSIEVDSDGPAVVANWVGALVRVRIGDDSGAIGRLMAPPLFRWSEHAFLLALLGAALPETDRLMLEKIVEHALRRAAERGRVPAVTALAEALAAFDPRTASRSLALGVRALRRLGASDSAAEVLRVAGEASVALDHGAIAFERALMAYLDGRPDEARRLAEASAYEDGVSAVVDGLVHASSAPPTVAPAARIGDALGDALYIELLARFATLCGDDAEPGDVRAAARRYDGGVDEDAFVGAFLEQRGMSVFRFAGGSAAARATLALERPFLLWRIVHDGTTFVDRPVLVRGLDAKTGLLVVDEPDLGRPELVPVSMLKKGRILCAVPRERDDALRRLAARRVGKLGARLGRAMTFVSRGELDAALAEIPWEPEMPPVAALYRGYVEHRRALGSASEAAALAPRAALLRSIASPPVLGIERAVLAHISFIEGERDDALSGLEAAIRLEPPTAHGALQRFAVLNAERRDEEALAALDEAVRLDPLDTRVLFMRATARKGRVDDTDGAREDVRRALDRSPRSAPMAIFLADLEVDAGRPTQAIQILDELHRYAPELEADGLVRLARRAASTALMRGADSVQALETFRRSPDPETRRQLAYVLAERADPDRELLLRKLTIDEDESVRVSVLRMYRRPWLLRRVKTEGVLVRVLIGLLDQDPAARVRALVVDVLGRSETPVGVRAVAATLSGDDPDRDPVVRAAAATALRYADVPETRRALVRALEDLVLEVRQAAADSLYRLVGSTRGFDPKAPEAERAVAVVRWQKWLDAQ